MCGKNMVDNFCKVFAPHIFVLNKTCYAKCTNTYTEGLQYISQGVVFKTPCTKDSAYCTPQYLINPVFCFLLVNLLMFTNLL